MISCVLLHDYVSWHSADQPCSADEMRLWCRDKPGGGGVKERVRKDNHAIGRMPIMLRYISAQVL
jgi:hypothetical protein